MKKLLLIVLGLTAAMVARAEDKTFKGESEASVVMVTGNADTETIGAKTTNTWNFSESDLATVFGKYISTKSVGVETGKFWDAGLRYERVFMKDVLNGFLQHKAEHDPYNGGYTQRDSTDLGVKYFFMKSDDLTWFGELGYRYTSVYLDKTLLIPADRYNSNGIRAYTEASAKLSDSASGKLWVEYIANLKDSDKSLINAEASVKVVMTSLLSLKVAYLLNHNEGVPAPAKKDTTTLTTSLVASY